MSVEKLAKMIRCCGYSPTNEEVICLEKEMKVNTSISLAEFLDILTAKSFGDENNSRQNCIVALRNFSKLRGLDSEFISECNLKVALTAMGKNPLSDTDFQQLMAQVVSTKVRRNASNDIHIEDFVSNVLLLF